VSTIIFKDRSPIHVISDAWIGVEQRASSCFANIMPTMHCAPAGPFGIGPLQAVAQSNYSWCLDVYALAWLFNQPIIEGTVPQQWKMAFITPIPKVSRSTKPSEFWPISVTQYYRGLLRSMSFSITSTQRCATHRRSWTSSSKINSRSGRPVRLLRR